MKVDIYELIERIRPRPAMYLGYASISRLQSFLYGYQIAVEELNSTITGDPPFGYFHDWIAMKLGKYESTAGWCNMLLESADGDEERALGLFFVHLDQFKQGRRRSFLRASQVKGVSGDIALTLPPVNTYNLKDLS